MDKKKFFRNIDRSGGEDSCWLWQKSKRSHGYGNAWDKHKGKIVYAHRAAYELANGPIPKGMHVCHHCDTPACVRPDHLFLGTPASNAADRNAKGRHSRGERHGRAKLCENDVREIKDLAAASRYFYREIAAMYGVSRSAICLITAGKRWCHLA